METKENKIVKYQKIGFGRVLKFLIPSIIGVLLLMTPFKNPEGGSTVAVSVISKAINAGINSVIPIHYIAIFCITVSTLLAIIYKIAKPAFIENVKILKDLSNITPFWLFARILGCIIGYMTILKVGPEIIWSDGTGGLILFELIGGLLTIFLVAGFILPFLTEFGLLEYVGIFLSKVMRPVFKLPGRAAVDCVASWIGDGTIGVALTNKQYEEGNYTEKEASVIATTFSAVSITFCLVVLENIGMVDYFGKFYLTVGVAGIVAAFLAPRIPPLSLKKDTRLREPENKNEEAIPEGYTRGQWALQLAVNKAEKNLDIKNFLKSGFETVLSLWIGVTPIIMAAGTLALVLSEATPIFTYLGMPFLPILNLLKVPEAVEASKTMVVGFADMVVPSILAQEGITSEMTKFIVGATSVTQLIYMSETGAVILGSNLPVNLPDLFIIFLERTLITLPVVVIFAHIFF
ncbi:nucleoside recognition membrane protein YjiH [Peptoniphilus koenoeneniae]|uniref:Nucleoside recognition membrane protein YjiH n=1 Tax=Peptoniphilus koenoeneniae TaxID=507751 RepID=A0ABU0AV42_9FIRM|nr:MULTISPECIES: YjiH family protein [Peptoniphilus]ERT60891.1 transporter gate domain protein [Peptoniphilus sp. BV3C26]MDQ0275126.1 nucleoside recognition membrane protein YjiH [Peptoniphilus koenoeneniae]